MKRCFVLLGLAAAVAAACNRPGPPSLQYAEARERLTQLRKEKGVDAYFDLRIDRVLELLSEVDSKSVDAPSAKELKAEIEKARSDEGARQAAEARAIELARTPPPMPDTSMFAPPETAPTQVPAGEVDAGPVDAGPPANPETGMPEAQFKSLFSGCFEYLRPFIGAGGLAGESWGLKDIAACRDRHKAFVGRLALLAQGKVQATPSEQEAPAEAYVLVDGKLVPASQVPPPAAPKDAGPPPEEGAPAMP